jgi:predicted RNA-binding protein with RPS1 domain
MHGGLGMDYITIGLLAVVVSTLGLVINLTRSVGDLRERLTRVEVWLSLLANVFTGQKGVMTSLIDHLGRKGIIDDVDAWKAALSGIESMILNPLAENKKRRPLECILEHILSVLKYILEYIITIRPIEHKKGKDEAEVIIVKADEKADDSLSIKPKDEKRRLLEYIKKGKDEFTLDEADDFLRLARKFFEEHMDKEQAWYLLFYATAIHGIVHGRYERKATPPNPNP